MSALSDAIGRLVAGFYNSLSKTPSNPGGLAGFGQTSNFPAALVDIGLVGEAAAQAATDAIAAAANALLAPGTKATCATSTAIPALNDTLTIAIVEAGKLFNYGHTVTVISRSNANWQFSGQITATYDPAVKSMQIEVAAVGAGTGSKSDLDVILTAPIDGSLTARVTTLETNATRDRRRAGFFGKGPI